MFYIDIFLKHFWQILPYLKTTFFVAVITFLCSILLGSLIASGMLGKNKLGQMLATAYINLMRCVPPIVLLFVVYYGSPYLVDSLFHKNINGMDAVYFAIISLSFLHAASFAEMMRGAYLAVGKGQEEAALSVGLTKWQTFYRIIFPQAFVVALPILGNSIVGLLKDGALAYSIGVVDITGRAQYLINMNLGGYVLETYLALALIYWILSWITQKGFGVLERRLRKG